MARASGMSRIMWTAIVAAVVSTLLLGVSGVPEARASTGATYVHPNLLRNGSFEATQEWANSYNGAPYSGRETGCALDGRYCLVIDDDSASESEGWRSGDTPISGGVQYTASAHARRASGVQGSLYLKFYSASGAEIASHAAETSGALGVWAQVSVTARAPAAATEAKLVVYSFVGRISEIEWDAVSLTRAGTHSLIDNEDFQLDTVGGGYPKNWYPRIPSSDDVAVGSDPLDESNLTLLIDTASGDPGRNAVARFEASSGTRYAVGADVLLESGSDPLHLYVKFFDADDTELSSTSAVSTSAADQWQRVDLGALAPAGTRYAQVLPACISSKDCAAYVDHVEAWEEWTGGTLFVAPTAAGAGDGSSASNAGSIHDSGFWNGVDAALASGPVQVVFLPGNYEMADITDRFLLSSAATNTHRLRLTSQDIYGTEFVLMGAWSSPSQMFVVQDVDNVTIRGMHFRQSFTASSESDIIWAAIHAISKSETMSDLVIDNVTVRDMPALKYAGISILTDAHLDGRMTNPRLVRSEFIRAGWSPGYHHVYAIFDVEGMLIDSSYFEDASGTFVKLRAQMTRSEVLSSRFWLSNDFATTPVALLQIPVYNSVNNSGDEWFGGGYRIQGNEFGGGSTLCSSGCAAVNIYHAGYNPTDDQQVTRDHLMDASAKATLDDTSTSNDAARKAIIADHFHVPVDDCDEGLCLGANSFTTGLQRVKLYVTSKVTDAEIYPNQGGNGAYDLSGLYDNSAP